jgi:hypothetical protein
MPTVNLKNGETQEIDLGNSNGLSATNVSVEKARFYVDYHEGGAWKPVTGEIKLEPGETRGWTRVELGHEHVRVGAQGLDDGSVIVRVIY